MGPPCELSAFGSSMSERYALYFVPADDSSLAAFGARLFGRWPDGSAVSNPLDLPQRLERTRRVARYGFHATLKAPFRLAPGRSESELLASVEDIGSRWRAASLHGLCVQAGSAHTSLRFGEQAPAESIRGVNQVARACVLDFDEFRAPLTDAERARRHPERLDARERALLERYGYPWILDRFAFHLTLSDQRQDDSDADWSEALEAHYRELVPDVPVLDRIAVCREREPGAPLLRISEVILTA